MATQKGTVNFTGKLGEVVGRKVNNKYTLSRPGGFTSERLKKGANKEYLPVTHINKEFGSGARAARSIYHAIGDDYLGNKTQYTYQRLTGAFYSKCHADSHTESGKRTLNEQMLADMVGHHLNPHAKGMLLNNYYISQLDPTTCRISFGNLYDLVKWPAKGAAIELFFIGIELDMKVYSLVNRMVHEVIYFKKETANIHHIDIPTPAKSCILLMGFRYYSTDKIDYNLMFNKKYSPLFIANYHSLTYKPKPTEQTPAAATEPTGPRKPRFFK